MEPTPLVFERALNLGVCPRCISLFVNPKNETILFSSDSEIVESLIALQPAASLYKEYVERQAEKICPSCFGFLSTSSFINIADDIHKQFDTNPDLRGRSFSLNVVYPTFLDVIRIIIRILVCQSVNKLGPSPSYAEVYSRLICRRLVDIVPVLPDESADSKVISQSNCRSYLLS